MPGFQSDVRSWMREADLFVLASRFEGLPNVLLEAIESECPVAVLNHPGGTREILEVLGLSRRWTSELARWEPEWFDHPAPQVREAAVARFGLETIVTKYVELFGGKAGAQRRAA
jgi:glycosyltransferase involved in cell wall biosynthesis